MARLNWSTDINNTAGDMKWTIDDYYLRRTPPAKWHFNYGPIQIVLSAAHRKGLLGISKGYLTVLKHRGAVLSIALKAYPLKPKIH